jgi:hypothetical protein
MEKCVFVGYPSGYKGWKFYNPTTQKYIISERAEFDERVFPGLAKYKATSPVDLKGPESPPHIIPTSDPVLDLGGDGDEDSCTPAPLPPAPIPLPEIPPADDQPPPTLPVIPPAIEFLLHFRFLKLPQSSNQLLVKHLVSLVHLENSGRQSLSLNPISLQSSGQMMKKKTLVMTNR